MSTLSLCAAACFLLIFSCVWIPTEAVINRNSLDVSFAPDISRPRDANIRILLESRNLSQSDARLKLLWNQVQSFEDDVHIATIEPKSGPAGGNTQVTINGMGFVSALADLTTYLKSENFRFGLDSGVNQTDEVLKRSGERGEQPVPYFFAKSIITSTNNESMIIGSSLPVPHLLVHLDVIDGLYLSIVPDLISETSMKFTIPSAELDLPPAEEDSTQQNIGPVSLEETRMQTTAKNVSEEGLQDDKEGPLQRLLLNKDGNATIITHSRQGQQLAMISLRFFPNPIIQQRNPQIFRIYPVPRITHVVPQTLSLAGNEALYLFGKHLFASDVIKVRFTSIHGDKSKIQDCEFVMASLPTSNVATSSSDVNRQIVESSSEQPTILCLSPQWTSDDNISISLSFNGQQYHRSYLPNREPLFVTYADVSSVLGAVVKGVVEREKDTDDNQVANIVATVVGEGNAGGLVENVGPKKDQERPESLQMLKVVDEKGVSGVPKESMNAIDGSSGHTKELDSPNDPNEPKHLPNYREKPKDLLSIHLEDAEDNYYVLSRPADIQKLRYDFRLVADLAVMVTASAIGGFIAESVKSPVILGGLIGGVVVGPQCLGCIQQLVQIASIAQLSSALLLFELGLHFSMKRVAKVRQAALWAGLIGHFCFIAVFVLFALMQKTSLSEAIILGCFVTMSSTVICIRDINGRRATETHEADVAIGVLLVQDVLLGLMLALLPALSMYGRKISLLGLASKVVIPFLNILLLTLTSLVIAVLILPRLLSHLYRHKSREVFLLCSLAGVLMMGLFAEHLGLSLELGAFAYGLIIASQSTVIKTEMESSMASIRDMFSALFFAAIGLVLDPIFVWDNLREIVSVLVMIMGLKFITFLICLLISRYDLSTSTRVALMLSNVGEFGFVILGKAAGIGLLGRKVCLLLLGTTGFSLILTPIFLKLIYFIPNGLNYYTPPNAAPFVDSLWCLRRVMSSSIANKIRYHVKTLMDHPHCVRCIYLIQILATSDYASVASDASDVTDKLPETRSSADVELGATSDEQMTRESPRNDSSDSRPVGRRQHDRSPKETDKAMIMNPFFASNDQPEDPRIRVP